MISRINFPLFPYLLSYPVCPFVRWLEWFSQDYTNSHANGYTD
jgi:hypothetical protein